MRSTLILCDWAEAIQGKLYLQGGGWNKVLSDVPINFAIAAMIRIDYSETNSRKHAVLALVDEDGGAVMLGDAALRFEFDFEVGRPPGMKPGQDQIVNFAPRVGGLTLAPGGYEFQLLIGDHRQDVAAFTAAPTLA